MKSNLQLPLMLEDAVKVTHDLNIYYNLICRFYQYTVKLVAAQGHKCVDVNANACGLDSHPRCFEAKRGVEFRHSTRNISRIRPMGNGLS